MSGKLGALPPIPARPQHTQAALYAAAGLLVQELPVLDAGWRKQ